MLKEYEIKLIGGPRTCTSSGVDLCIYHNMKLPYLLIMLPYVLTFNLDGNLNTFYDTITKKLQHCNQAVY